MPEYLAPIVYVEEIGAKPIEGMSTSTSGFLGLTEWGPERPPLITWLEQTIRPEEWEDRIAAKIERESLNITTPLFKGRWYPWEPLPSHDRWPIITINQFKKGGS